MNRTTSITLAVILVVATVAVPLAAANVVPSSSVQSESDAGNESIAPGERFAAAVGVQNAEINGNVSERTFEARVANAASNESKAAVIVDQFNASETRQTELENRLAELNESRTAGELSEGRYQAEVATTVAEMRTVERQATAAETAAAELPEGVLEEQNVDVEAIRALRDRAGDRGGPETAAIARSIAGDDVDRATTDYRAPGGSTDRPGESQADDRDDDSERGSTAASDGN
ncbi:hypothetical protein [Natronorubrum aibiense]|uniref:Uncharacterized protein n=1 Tax=Natronorubrum aibiense TaxID=348826 RepID=A0A5P9P2M3_9EURY|nr:hypothetical protein [Natronorubrum aibiense]QFU82385.1 hypothetical protein GCU68_07530 [Natronorubrum aibiense]